MFLRGKFTNAAVGLICPTAFCALADVVHKSVGFSEGTRSLVMGAAALIFLKAAHNSYREAGEADKISEYYLDASGDVDDTVFQELDDSELEQKRNEYTEQGRTQLEERARHHLFKNEAKYRYVRACSYAFGAAVIPTLFSVLPHVMDGNSQVAANHDVFKNDNAPIMVVENAAKAQHNLPIL